MDLTLKMTSAQVVETSVANSSSSLQDCPHPDDHTIQTALSYGSLAFFFLAEQRYQEDTSTLANKM